MSTICLGLLIAIGLEQSIEWLHRRHELRELRESLRRDDERAILDSEHMRTSVDARLQWLQERETQVRRALRDRKELAAAPPSQGIAADIPANPTWRAAKASGLLALVPEEEVKAYSELEFLILQSDAAWQGWQSVQSKLEQFEAEFGSSGNPDGSDFSPIPPESLRKYLELILEETSAANTFRTWCVEIRETEGVVFHGERNLDRIEQAEKLAHKHK